MQIKACPKCGSKNIQIGTMGAGVTFGVTSWKSVCKNCGYQGEPLLFDSEKEYIEFIHQCVKDTTSSEAVEPEQEETSVDLDEDVTADLSKKDRETVELLKEELQCEETTDTEGVIPKNKSWWPEIGVAIIFSFVWTVLSAFGFNLFLGSIGTVFYGIFYFIFLTVVILFIIVVIEYFGYSIKKIMKRKRSP